MKISLNWLSELVDLPWTADQLPERLSALGFPVESIERTGVQATGVIAVKILTVDKHPNADRLRIAKVTDGSTERTIVCGAPNIAPGQTVPLATPGARLPGGIEITISKIRGVESGGMLCSERELGLSEEHAGILQLPAGTALGKDVAEALGGHDVVFDVEVTPNRPDVLCHVGLARELAALAKTKLKMPDDTTAAGKDDVDIRIDEPTLCSRYLGRVINGVRIGPSPEWMVRRLTACGIRSINNVVDITNYVLLEWGHPLHAFDLALLKGPSIRVRRAAAGEKFLALDEKTYALSPQDLVVADKERAVAIAGIMGGQATGVTDKTADVLLESAVFDRTAVRQTSRRLGLKSESSYRFEKGTDADTAERAWRRAARLIADLAGGRPAGQHDEFPKKTAPSTVNVHRARLASLLGVSVPDSVVGDVLGRLGFAVKETTAGWACVTPPHRKDIVEAADIAEEVIRLVGYNTVPSSLSGFRVGRPDIAFRPIPSSRLVQSLRGYGLSETLTSSFCPPDWPERFGVPSSEVISLANPIAQDESALRPFLAVNLLRAAIRNFNHQRAGVALFEIGKTFLGSEESRLGIVLAGVAQSKEWRSPEQETDIFRLKGILEALARDTRTGFGLEPAAPVPFLHPKQSFALTHRGRVAGWAGLINPRLAAAIDLSIPCALAEIDLAVFAHPAPSAVAPIPKYPFVERDIAVVVGQSTAWGAIRAEAEKAGGALLVGLHPFDVFSGGSLAAGSKSVAFRIRLQDPTKTLSEAEISSAVERITSALQKHCGAQLRS